MPDIAEQLDRAIGAAPSDGPALETTLALGRRTLLRRRMAYGVGTAATALVIGGTAWAVSPGDSPNRSDDPGFVGEPSDSPSAPDAEPQPPQDGVGSAGMPWKPGDWPGIPRDDLVVLGPDDSLVPLVGVRILEQRPTPDVGESFATAGDTSAVALVEKDGKQWYVLARRGDDIPEQYIAVTKSEGGKDLDAFLELARERYAEGGGGLL